MNKWKIRVEVWPYSVQSAAEDQKAAGDREREIIVVADDIAGAMRFAEVYVKGILANPRVWQAPIMGIVRATACGICGNDFKGNECSICGKRGTGE